ncbi:hypothetical protein B0J14DRAFT_566230 [Halenospora varia]|nr:hypothetical protein B0J14DRAFT_566230 [Halenospora varia]
MTIPSRKYGYQPNASPWNKRVLIILWILQAGFSICVSIVGGALIPAKGKERRGDDGYSSVFYIISTMITIGASGMSLGFTIMQVLHFHQNRLHPMWVLIMSCISTSPFLVVIIMAGWGLAVGTPSGKWSMFEGSLLLDIVAAVPYIFGLTYSSIVFAKFKKNQKIAQKARHSGIVEEGVQDVELGVVKPVRPSADTGVTLVESESRG